MEMRTPKINLAWRASIAMLATFMLSSAVSHSTSAPSATSENLKKHVPCRAELKKLSRDRLREIALETAQAKGISLERNKFESKIVVEGCDWHVSVLYRPADPKAGVLPGSDFSVIIDGVSGKVKSYEHGY